MLKVLAVVGDVPAGLAGPDDWRIVVEPEPDDPDFARAGPGERALLAAPGAGVADVARMLDGPLGLAAPMLDFSGECPRRADVSGERLSSESLAQALYETAPILRALTHWPDARDRVDAHALGALAFAQSRDRRIEPAWAPDRRQGMRYPALFGVAGSRRLLDALADEGLLERRHAARLHRCGTCGSSRLNAAEHCPECDSSFLHDERLIHHYACGHQGPQSEFGARGAMRCPKCGKRPRHFGVDYDSPGVVVMCGACGRTADPPVVKFTCADCANQTPADGAEAVDWFSFGLTEDGVAALRSGKRPRVRVADAFEPIAQSRSLKEFGRMLLHDLDVAGRYDRPITIVRGKLESAEALVRQYGREQVADAFRLLAELTGEALRESDLMAVSENAVLIAMPETTPENARHVLERLNESVLQNIAIDLSFTTTFMDRAEAEHFLAERGLRPEPAHGADAAAGRGAE